VAKGQLQDLVQNSMLPKRCLIRLGSYTTSNKEKSQNGEKCVDISITLQLSPFRDPIVSIIVY
jgi:hypothetical protein